MVILLSGCVKNNITPSNNSNELFENRLRCNSLKEQIKNEVIDQESNTAFVKNNGEGNFWIYYELNDVFYSPQKQSCLYIVKMTYPKESPIRELYQLNDYFTKFRMSSCSYGKKIGDDTGTDEFLDLVKKLKEEKNDTK